MYCHEQVNSKGIVNEAFVIRTAERYVPVVESALDEDLDPILARRTISCEVSFQSGMHRAF